MTHVLASPLPVGGIRSARSGIPVLFHALAALCVVSLLVVSQNAAPAELREVSAEGRAVFEQAKGKLLQIRVLHKATGAQASMGSGFLASADGLVLTNYHVVADVALEPKTYELEFERSDGTTGKPRLLAVDVANDLSLIHI